MENIVSVVNSEMGVIKNDKKKTKKTIAEMTGASLGTVV